MQEQFIRFLEEEMGLSGAAIAVAARLLERMTLHQPGQPTSLLPIVLWQYGLLTIEQLDRVFDWLETA